LTLPADAIPVIDWPEYAITPDGQVWRTEPHARLDCLHGPVPRKLKPVMMGVAPKRLHPSIVLSRDGWRMSRTIAALIRQHFGE
jgi:hypothetical protein